MNTNQNKSSAGEWLFLVGGVGAIGGYFIYENSASVAVWLQALANAPIIPSGGLLAWLIGNWGLVLLIAAIIFAAYRLWSDSTVTITTNDGSKVKYHHYKYIPVKLIR